VIIVRRDLPRTSATELSGLPQMIREDNPTGAVDAETNNSLGVLYSSRGDSGFLAAAEYFRKAADQGYSIAQTNLGLMYVTGQGTARNWPEAEKWFVRSAAQGDPGAQYHLGVHHHRRSMLNQAETVHEARIEAFKWFQLAAQQGYWKADVCLERVNLQMNQEDLNEARRRVQNFVVRKEGPGQP